MANSLACPECGSTLLADAPRGLCPHCLMNAADPSSTIDGAVTLGPDEPAITEHGQTMDARKTVAEAFPQAVARSFAAVRFDDFKHAIIELGLLDSERFDRRAAGFQSDVAGLALALVKDGTLTEYQARAIAQRKERGLIVGNYLILSKLGVGGMGVVFKALHRRLNRVVALKLLPPSFGRDADAVRRFRREVQLAARLNHPNIVAVLDADEDRGVQFLTMDYIEGNDLDQLVSSGGALPLGQALDCLIQAARGLEAAHAQTIVHRDVKPGNLMLDVSGTVRVLDLGLARVIEASHPHGQSALTTLTQSGTYMGSVDFMAPEQAEDSRRVDHRADIYSLGCTLYFLLTGKAPFEGSTVLRRLMAHQQQPAPRLGAARPDVPPALETVYQAMMSKPPSDRPQSMTEVIARLNECRTSDVETKVAHSELITFAQTAMKRVAAPREEGDVNELSLPLVLSLEPEPLRPIRQVTRPQGLSIALGTLATLCVGLAWFALSPERARTNPTAAPVSKPSASVARDVRVPFKNSLGMPFVPIEAGTFLMGASDSDDAAQKDERPQHRVTITRSFYLGATEVTRGQFRRFMNDTLFQTQAERDGKGGWAWDARKEAVVGHSTKFNWRRTGFSQTDHHPVVNVSWTDANEFCRWLSQKEKRNYRLPTEAEWEYACRAGTTSRYTFGDDPAKLAALANVNGPTDSPNVSTDSPDIVRIFTSPVGSYPPNAWGLYDMDGNVREWCNDWYVGEYYKASPPSDPLGPSTSSGRVRRGGGWRQTARDSRSSDRNGDHPEAMGIGLGFRVALVPSSP